MFVMPKIINRSSDIECSGSGITLALSSKNTVFASSKEIRYDTYSYTRKIDTRIHTVQIGFSIFL